MKIENDINGVFLTPLKIIDTPGGDVLHGMKFDDPGFNGFGEAYFSNIEPEIIKGWKRHKLMTLNLIVPIGIVRFVIYDDRVPTCSHTKFREIILSKRNYQRLTIPPMVWFAFQGLGKEQSLVLNIANIKHESEEVDQKLVNEIDFDW